MSKMIIANRLSDGLVVFFGPDSGWVTSIDDGILIEAPDDADASLAEAKLAEGQCLVIDPNLIDVDVRDGRRRPTAIREAIRAFGPSPAARTDAQQPNAR